MKRSSNEESAMTPYLANNSIITIEPGQLFVTLMIKEEKIVTGFQFKNNYGELIHSINQQIDDSANIRYEIFQLDELYTIMEAQVQYKIEHNAQLFEGDEALRLFFNPDSIQNVDDID